MIEIYNGDTIQELIRAGLLQSSFDIPKLLAKEIIPTIEINPILSKFCDIVRNASITNTTQATIFTTPDDPQISFFLIACSLSVIKDVLSTSTLTQIDIVVDGANRQVLNISGITLTAQNSTISIVLPHPLKIDRNTSITLNNGTAIANIRADASIVGFLKK